VDDDMEIPVALVGEECHKLIHRLADSMETYPICVFRHALRAGLVGESPLLAEHLELLADLVEEGARLMPDKPKTEKPS
jgi:hypothetical protein